MPKYRHLKNISVFSNYQVVSYNKYDKKKIFKNINAMSLVAR